MRKTIKTIFLSLLIFALMSVSTLQSFAIGDYPTLNLYIYKLYGTKNIEDNTQGCLTFVTNHGELGLNLEVKRYTSPLNYVYFKVFDKNNNIIFGYEKVLSNSYSDFYNDPELVPLPSLNSYEDQANYKIVAKVRNTAGYETCKTVNVIYTKKNYAIGNLCEYIPACYNGSFNVSAKIYDLTSAGISKVSVGVNKMGVPLIYYSNNVNLVQDTNLKSKYHLNCTLRTDIWTPPTGDFGDFFRINGNNTSYYQQIRGNYFTIN